jgi:hypothetical protein
VSGAVESLKPCWGSRVFTDGAMAEVGVRSCSCVHHISEGDMRSTRLTLLTSRVRWTLPGVWRGLCLLHPTQRCVAFANQGHQRHAAPATRRRHRDHLLRNIRRRLDTPPNRPGHHHARHSRPRNHQHEQLLQPPTRDHRMGQLPHQLRHALLRNHLVGRRHARLASHTSMMADHLELR